MMALLFTFFLAHAQSMSRPPVHAYWHLYTDSEGVSRLKRCEFQKFSAKSSAQGAALEWMNQIQDKAGAISLTTQPISWQGMWHEFQKPQWVVTLAGKWFLTSMDGQKIEFNPGDVLFAEDQNTKEDARGYRGHMSGNVGAEPTTLMHIQTGARPEAGAPCRTK